MFWDSKVTKIDFTQNLGKKNRTFPHSAGKKGQNSAEPTTTCLKEGAINYDIFIVQHGLLPREYICVNKHLESPSGDLGWDEIPKVSFHKAY